jgi:predicted RNA methylase
LVLLAVALAGCATQTVRYPPFWWTPHGRVEQMLAIAEVTADDVVYDLGSGDGRIVIAAAKLYGARGVGIEISPALVEQSVRNAEEAGVADRVRFVQGDFHTADFSEATVVTLYLFKETNEQLAPLLLEQLAPDARIVTYKYPMPGWTPVRRHEKVYLYELPARPPD